MSFEDGSEDVDVWGNDFLTSRTNPVQKAQSPAQEAAFLPPENSDG
ncbi:MAG: hypothetical protein JWM16_2350 [Verrucomicrobiales bacterium]|nr:hypothetical protein [Verrucomicrobiales bacterium]